MHHRSFIVVVATISMLLFASMSSSIASGHAPEFPSGNTSIATAWEVHDPAKSWTIYASLPDGTVHYYEMEFNEGERILLDLIIPVDEEERGFVPVMALIGPGLTQNGPLPSYVDVPSDMVDHFIPSQAGADPEFEPFSPGTFVRLSSYGISAPETGTYYVAVWEGPTSVGGGGNYAFPVGFTESFALEEMVLMPFSLVKVYTWEGQDQLLVLAPMALMLVIGFGFFVWKRYQLIPRMRAFHYPAYFAGLLIAGSGLITATQFVLSSMDSSIGSQAFATVLIMLAQLGIGLYLLRTGYLGKKASLGKRVLVLVLGLAAVFAWAGYLIGPAIAMFGAFLPSFRKDDRRR